MPIGSDLVLKSFSSYIKYTIFKCAPWLIFTDVYTRITTTLTKYMFPLP